MKIGTENVQGQLYRAACTKTRNTGTARNTGTPEHRNTGTPEHRNTGTPAHPRTPEQAKNPGTANLTVLFCFPITDHVKNVNVNLFPHV